MSGRERGPMFGKALAAAIAWHIDGRKARGDEAGKRSATLIEINRWNPRGARLTIERVLADWTSARWKEMPADGYCPADPDQGHSEWTDYYWGRGDENGHPYCGACGYIDKARTV